MSRYVFPGYSAFLRDAARLIGRPQSEAQARGIATLAALGNLCAQAGATDPAHVAAIMAKAEEFRDQLHAAHKAADLMLSDVRRGLGLPQGRATGQGRRQARSPGGEEMNRGSVPIGPYGPGEPGAGMGPDRVP